MAKPKPLKTLIGESLAEQACNQTGFNPFLAVCKKAVMKVYLKEHETADVLPEGWHNEWDMEELADGRRMLVPKKEFVLECAKAMMPYLAPQLKSSEVKQTTDMSITWVVKSFAGAGELKVVEEPKQISNE